MSYKLHQAKKLLWRFSGLSRNRWKSLPAGLYCFNYHRIGDADSSSFDPNVFSCDTERLDAHVRTIKQNFEIVTTGDVPELVVGSPSARNRYALITFDDGYIDNFTEALPVLSSNGVTGLFFLCEMMLSNPAHLQWWDELALLVRKGGFKEYRLGDLLIDIGSCRSDKERVRRVLNACKQHPELSVLECLELIRAQVGVALTTPENRPRLFMGWDEAIQLHRAGMEIGSHTLSHRILSQLSDEEQEYELTESRDILEKRIGCNVNSVAYPVGTSGTYNKMTCRAAQRAGYTLGFNNIAGANKLPLISTHDLFRFPVDGNPSPPAFIDDVCLPYRG